MQRVLNIISSRLRQHRAALAALMASGIKASGALLNIAVFTLAARALSADEFGHLAVWFNVVSLLAVVAVFGQDILLVRSWSEYTERGEHATARAAYWFGWRGVVRTGLSLGAGLILVAFMFGLYGGPATFFAGAAFLVAQAALSFSSQSCRVIVGFVVSEVNRELTWRVLLLAVVIWGVATHSLSLPDFFYAGAVGVIFSVGFECLAVRRRFLIKPVVKATNIDRSSWRRRGRSMWLSASVEAASQYADVMIIGFFTSPAAAGEYFVAARFAAILLMVSVGLHTYSLTHCARLYFSKQTDELQRILRAIAMVALGMLMPVVAVIIVAGKSILLVFGDHYAAVYPTLVVLSSATFVVAICGPAPGILLTTGHERLYSRLISSATVVRLAITAMLAMKFGAIGAAFGWAIVNAPLAVGLAILCRVRCGVDPSVVSLILHKRPARWGASQGRTTAGPLRIATKSDFTGS